MLCFYSRSDSFDFAFPPSIVPSRPQARLNTRWIAPCRSLGPKICKPRSSLSFRPDLTWGPTYSLASPCPRASGRHVVRTRTGHQLWQGCHLHSGPLLPSARSRHCWSGCVSGTLCISSLVLSLPIHRTSIDASNEACLDRSDARRLPVHRHSCLPFGMLQCLLSAFGNHLPTTSTRQPGQDAERSHQQFVLAQSRHSIARFA